MKGKEFLIPPKSEVMATVGHTCPHAVENLNELFHARRFFFFIWKLLNVFQGFGESLNKLRGWLQVHSGSFHLSWPLRLTLTIY